MKIGIVTYHSDHNYGAMLQAYALQKFIKQQLLADVQIINYIPKVKIHSSHILPKINSLKSLAWCIIKLFYYKSIKRKHNSFEYFLEKYMDKTKVYYSYEELLKDPPIFDLYITGSDQTFNPNSIHIYVFFLAFCPKGSIKISYAPSFGYSFIPENKQAILKALLEDYSYLSVRETSGSNIINSLISKNVPSVLDPVFLVKRDEWKNIAKPLKIKYKSFILCYSLIGNKLQMDIAIQLKEKTGLPIILLTHTVFSRTKADLTINCAGPLEFLWLFDHSNYVVTDSFHGTAFSVLFEKPFYSCIVLKEKSDRIIDLLRKLDLEDRVISDQKMRINGNIDIEYNKIADKLEEERKRSIDYLLAAIYGY
mgnify:CR=1 FL=1